MLGADLARMFYMEYCTYLRESAQPRFNLRVEWYTTEDRNIYREMTSATLTALIRDGLYRRYYVRS